jgi:hypothetical protein
MNERIRELYQQSHMVREYPSDDPWRGGNPATVYWGGERSAEKFAQLIIQEFANIGDNYQDILGNEPECFNCRKVAYGIVDKIKQHFGVE